MSEYHKIETLYERDEKTHKLKPELILKNPTYGLLKEWEWTEKIDGTNIRVMWSPEDRSVRFGGRTDNALMDAQLLQTLMSQFPASAMETVFPDAPAIIYGEGYGAGIQKGGGYSETKKFIAYDVLVGCTWWLNWANTCDVCKRLGCDVVPFIGAMSLEDATEMVRAGFPSCVGGGKVAAEGLVGRPSECLYDKKMHRLFAKLKTKDF